MYTQLYIYEKVSVIHNILVLYHDVNKIDNFHTYNNIFLHGKKFLRCCGLIPMTNITLCCV